MTLTPHTTAVLLILGALAFVACCSRIPVVGPIIVIGVVVGVIAGIAGISLTQGIG